VLQLHAAKRLHSVGILQLCSTRLSDVSEAQRLELAEIILSYLKGEGDTVTFSEQFQLALARLLAQAPPQPGGSRNCWPAARSAGITACHCPAIRGDD